MGAELLLGPGQSGPHRVQIGEVHREGGCGDALGAELLGHLPELLRSARHEGDAVALGAEPPGDGAAQTRSCPQYCNGPAGCLAHSYIQSHARTTRFDIH